MPAALMRCGWHAICSCEGEAHVPSLWETPLLSSRCGGEAVLSVSGVVTSSGTGPSRTRPQRVRCPRQAAGAQEGCPPSALHRLPPPVRRCWIRHLPALSTLPEPSGQPRSLAMAESMGARCPLRQCAGLSHLQSDTRVLSYPFLDEHLTCAGEEEAMANDSFCLHCGYGPLVYSECPCCGEDTEEVCSDPTCVCQEILSRE
jgi:hypothetical protein